MPQTPDWDSTDLATSVEHLERAIRYAECDPHGGKVLLDLREAHRLLKLLEQVSEV